LILLKKPPLKLTNRKPSAALSFEPIKNPYHVPINSSDFIPTCRIRSGASFVGFQLYDYQIKLLEIIENHVGIILVKDRQTGCSELLAARALHKSLLDPAYVGAFISIGQDKSSDLRDRCRQMPTINGLSWDRNSGKALEATGCGKLIFLPSTVNALRGLPSVVEAIFDECGFIPDMLQLYSAGTAAQEMVSDDVRKTILCSTIPPEGAAHPFWQMFASNNNCSALDQLKKARNQDTNCDIPGMVWWTDDAGWAKVIISSSAHPKYGKMLPEDYIQSVMDRRKVPRAIALREHALGIEVAGSSLFNSAAIDLQAVGQWQVAATINRKYMAMVDPNFGGSDNFVALILDITDPIASIVAEYAEADKSIEYSEGKTLELCDQFGVSAIAIESNSGGKIVVEDIQRKRPALKVLLTLTTSSSKKTNTDRVALAIEQGQLIYPKDWKGISEMRSFSAQHREAVSGEKDDRIMALAAGFAHVDEVRKVRGASVGWGKVRR
jgi:hypothetical protein